MIDESHFLAGSESPPHSRSPGPPTPCPQCGHRVLPDVSAGRCPTCGRECTRRAEKPNQHIADELFFRRERRSYWGLGFWVLLIVGPVYVAAFSVFESDILSSMPPSLRPYAEVSSNPVLALSLCAAGAGFCLANLWFPRERLRDILAYAVLIGFLILVFYGGLILPAAHVIRLIARLIH